MVGIGINCRDESFPPELETVATSLLAQGSDVAVEALAAAMVEALEKMSRTLFTHKKALMDRYRRLCITTGKTVQVIRQDSVREAFALHVEADGSLLVRYPDGAVEAVSSGEVSVRGMYGYI